MKRILCILGMSLFAFRAFAGEVDDNLKKFEAVIQKAEAGHPDLHMEPPLSDRIQSLRINISMNNWNGALDELRSCFKLEQYGVKLDAQEKQALPDLMVSIQAEKEKQERAETASIEAAVAHAAAAVKKAKTAADLDACIDELMKVQVPQEERQGKSKAVTAQYGRADDAFGFVVNYQAYLAAKAGGFGDKAREIALELANFPCHFLPRSELLAKAYEPKKAGEAEAQPSNVEKQK